MMYDDLNASNDPQPELGFTPKTPGAKPERNRTDGTRPEPMADREVPLPAGHATTLLVHQWLDGDVAATAVRASTGGNDAVDLWTKINDEAELLRSRTTPLYVHKRIMESLPDDMYRLNQPWYKRSVLLNPAAMILAAATLLGIGALIARLAAH